MFTKFIVCSLLACAVPSAFAERLDDAKLDQLVKQLGAEDFEQRESAQQTLLLAELDQPKLMAKLKQAYKGSRDPELQTRCYELLAKLISRRGFIGISMGPSDSTLQMMMFQARNQGANGGQAAAAFEPKFARVIIEDMTPDSPAAKHDLRKGDIIMAVDDVAIDFSKAAKAENYSAAVQELTNQVRTLIQRKNPGQTLKLSVLRPAQEADINKPLPPGETLHFNIEVGDRNEILKNALQQAPMRWGNQIDRGGDSEQEKIRQQLEQLKKELQQP